MGGEGKGGGEGREWDSWLGGGKVLINFLNCKKKLLRFYSLKEVEKIKMKICKKKKQRRKNWGGGG